MREIVEIILGSAEGAFLEVGAFVGAVLLIFGYINYRQKGGFVKKIEEMKKIQPIIGALLGLSPGCGGAIFVMPLFIKKKITFGTVIATLIATMGDSAFVIIYKMPFAYIGVSIISFIVAIIVGYIVDYYAIGEKLLLNRKIKTKDECEKIHKNVDHKIQERECGIIEGCINKRINHIGHEEGDEFDIVLHHKVKGHEEQNTIGYYFTHSAYKIFWIFISIGLIFGIMLLMQVDINNLIIPNIGLIFGVSGTLFSIIMMILSKKKIQVQTHEEEELKVMSFKETLVHNAEETAFVITWVFIAYLIYEFSIFCIGGGNYLAGEKIFTDVMMANGFYTVIAGAVIGLIPGCGPQVLFVTLYTKGLIPFAALLANAISQDGDALFPLLAIDRKSSLWATIITTIPALILGIIVYIISII